MARKFECKPYDGEFDFDRMVCLDSTGNPYLVGKRKCGNADCVNLSHIIKKPSQPKVRPVRPPKKVKAKKPQIKAVKFPRPPKKERIPIYTAVKLIREPGRKGNLKGTQFQPDSHYEWIADFAAPTQRYKAPDFCAVPDCGQYHFCKSLCRKHYNDLIYFYRRAGRTMPKLEWGNLEQYLDEPRNLRTKVNEPCNVPDCDNRKRSRGLCEMHYMRLLKQRKGRVDA